MNPEGNNVPNFLEDQFEDKSFFESFSFLWKQWTSRPHIEVEGLGWTFKLLLWCLSVLDISTDLSLFFDYIGGTKEYYG